jgi:hypothetical protein
VLEDRCLLSSFRLTPIADTVEDTVRPAWTTVSNNNATAPGGGIDNAGTLTISDSTTSGHTAQNNVLSWYC